MYLPVNLLQPSLNFLTSLEDLEQGGLDSDLVFFGHSGKLWMLVDFLDKKREVLVVKQIGVLKALVVIIIVGLTKYFSSALVISAGIEKICTHDVDKKTNKNSTIPIVKKCLKYVINVHSFTSVF